MGNWASGGLGEAAELWAEGADESEVPRARRRKVGGPRAHPSPYWDKLLDGQEHVLVRGKDFTSSMAIMARRATRAGDVRDLRVQAMVRGQTLTIRAMPSATPLQATRATQDAVEVCKAHGWKPGTILGSARWGRTRELAGWGDGAAVLKVRDGEFAFSRSITVKTLPSDVHEVKP